MRDDDLLSLGDWIKIKIKFSGVCLNCKEKISTGEFGYWSRKAKAIVHDKCYLQLIRPSQQKVEEGNREKDRKQVSKKNNPDSPIFELPDNAQCYICNNHVDINDPLFIELFKIKDKEIDVGTFYCAICLKGFDTAIFNEYKTSFQRKIKR
jgi:hypothetical protein